MKTLLRSHVSTTNLKPGYKAYEQAIVHYLLGPLVADIDLGDITSEALLTPSQKVTTRLVSKQKGVLAGMQELAFFLKRYMKGIKLSSQLKDGATLKPGTVIGFLQGSSKDILKIERTVLNFLQHMCGVATLASDYVEEVRKYPVLICPTRKTPWGLLDKRACVVGGAGTHRLNLHDAVLVKDTHLDILKHDFKKIGEKLKSAAPLGRFVEIEVGSVRDGWKAAELLLELQKSKRIPCFIMLDNMKPQSITSFVKQLRLDKKYSGIFLEASGGITLKNIQRYAQTGVDVLSVGVITHSAPALDISLKIAA